MTKPTGNGFIKLTHTMVDGDAFAAASSGATRLLILLWRRYNGRNNGAIPCSIREAAAWLHCGKSAAAGYFVELQELGLIEPVKKGHFTIKRGGRGKPATTWRLIFLPHSEGNQDDHDRAE